MCFKLHTYCTDRKLGQIEKWNFLPGVNIADSLKHKLDARKSDKKYDATRSRTFQKR